MSLIKFTLNDPVLDLDGHPLPPPGQTTGKTLAQMLMVSSKGQVIKFAEWALKMHRGETIELDTADYDLLYKFIEDCQLPIVTKYPILMTMRKAKETGA
jgi:hypothetical protein